MRDYPSHRVLTVEGTGKSGRIYLAEVKLGTLTEKGIIRMLQRLVASHLTPAEIISASLPQNATGYRPLLEPKIGPAQISVGVMPYYVATVTPADTEGGSHDLPSGSAFGSAAPVVLNPSPARGAGDRLQAPVLTRLLPANRPPPRATTRRG